MNIQLSNTKISNILLPITAIELFILIIILVLPITDIFHYDMAVNRCTFVNREEKNISNRLKYFLRQIYYSVVCFQGKDSLKQIIILLNGKIMHVIEWVTKTVNRDGKN